MTDIHIIAPFHDANGGDWRAIDLYLYLRAENNVHLWSPQKPNAALRAAYPIHEIKPYSGQLPSSGTLIIWGALTEVGHWYEHITFDKIVLIHNLFAPEILYRGLNCLTLAGKRHVELGYVSEMLKKAVGLPGDVFYLMPHPERFQPCKKEAPGTSFTVGRVSRDVIGKHHFADPALYRKLADDDIYIKIVGGTCLAPWLGDTANVKLLPELPQESIPEMLSTFDCFYYRTSLAVKEAFGLVVVEAMLCGLPVVCHRQGGYAEIIEHGVNGFLFETNKEAEDILQQLRKNIQLRRDISNNAANLSLREGLYGLELEFQDP